MTRYNTFLLLFIISVLALVVFLAFYIKAVMGIVAVADELKDDKATARYIINVLLNPQVIISLMIMGLSSLAYRVMGIVYVAKNKIASDGEKAVWIIGFIFMGFITGVVFLIMARGKQFVE